MVRVVVDMDIESTHQLVLLGIQYTLQPGQHVQIFLIFILVQKIMQHLVLVSLVVEEVELLDPHQVTEQEAVDLVLPY